MDYVIFVRDILVDQTNKLMLLVTKYSFLSAFFALKTNELNQNDDCISERELLLHFADFDSMGERHDATVINVDDITQAWRMTDITSNSHFVQYVGRKPQGRANGDP